MTCYTRIIKNKTHHQVVAVSGDIYSSYTKGKSKKNKVRFIIKRRILIFGYHIKEVF